MKVILYMAMSLNSMIDRPKGDEDFLSEANWKMFLQLVRRNGNVILGRKTVEAIDRWGPDYALDLPEIEKVMLTRNPKRGKFADWYPATSPEAAVSYLASRGKKTALLSGGAETNAAFATVKLIDEVLVNIEPVIIPNGIPLLVPNAPDLQLKLLKKRNFGSSGLTLHYKVIR